MSFTLVKRTGKNMSLDGMCDYVTSSHKFDPTVAMTEIVKTPHMTIFMISNPKGHHVCHECRQTAKYFIKESAIYMCAVCAGLYWAAYSRLR